MKCIIAVTFIFALGFSSSLRAQAERTPAPAAAPLTIERLEEPAPRGEPRIPRGTGS